MFAYFCINHSFQFIAFCLNCFTKLFLSLGSNNLAFLTLINAAPFSTLITLGFVLITLHTCCAFHGAHFCNAEGSQRPFVSFPPPQFFGVIGKMHNLESQKINRSNQSFSRSNQIFQSQKTIDLIKKLTIKFPTLLYQLAVLGILSFDLSIFNL